LESENQEGFSFDFSTLSCSVFILIFTPLRYR
jgi:hypothetical protein